ncbi:MAG TPA: hypothetical protein VG734_00835 [Lacunisphaera sp.]|nr:hypothetical protein [Lacunisphaera sp.]
MRVFLPILWLVLAASAPHLAQGIEDPYSKRRVVRTYVDVNAGFTKARPVYLLISPQVAQAMKQTPASFAAIAREEGVNLVPRERAEYVMFCDVTNVAGFFLTEMSLRVYRLMPDKKSFDQAVVWWGSAELKLMDAKDANSASIRALLSVLAEEYEGEAPRRKKPPAKGK